MSPWSLAIGVLLVLWAGAADAVGNFSSQLWGNVTPVAGLQVDAGEFTGDTRDDVLVYQPTNGMLRVLPSTAATFVTSGVAWAVVSPAADWQFEPGDFAGDGRDDLVAYHPSNGTVWIATNTGAAFSFSIHGTLSPTAGWEIFAGNFGGDGRTDVMAYQASTGEIRVAINAGAGFSFASWASVSASSAWTFAVGDFDGNGAADLAGFQAGSGALQIAINTGDGFSLVDAQASLDASIAWGLHAGDYDVDGLVDLFAYDPTTGNRFVGRNSGASFDFSLGVWGAPVAPPGGWQFHAGDFDGDGEVNHVGYASSNGTLWTFHRSFSDVEGYAWPLSAAPGGTIDFMASGAAEPTVEFFRHTSIDAEVQSTWMGAASYAPTNQPTNPLPWRNGAGWQTSFSQIIPDDWSSGIYSARLTGLGGSEFHVPFVVKPPPTRRPTVAVLANVNTWLAYNRWGGSGKYLGSAEVSFLRPNPNAQPVASGFDPDHLTRAELWVLGWLEAEGYEPHVYTDIDFHNGEVGTRYDQLVLDTHPEYFTLEMYARLEEHLAAGGSLLYIGGNGIYETASYLAGSDQTRMQFLNGVENGPREPAMFRNQTTGTFPPQAAAPERALLGVATEACGVLGSPFRVREPDHPIFANTGVVMHQDFGSSGFNTAGGLFPGGMASAFEVDTSAGPGALQCSSSCQCNPSYPTPPSNLPSGLIVVAKGTGTIGGEITYYVHPGGGHVVSIGSITAGGSLVIDPVLSQIARNTLGPPGSPVPMLGALGRVLLVLMGISSMGWVAIKSR